MPVCPDRLGRRAYVRIWSRFTLATVFLTITFAHATIDTPWAPIIAAPGLAWFAIKVICLDPARLRSIGWTPYFTFVSFIWPFGIIFQFVLFFTPNDWQREEWEPSRSAS